jgi:hypothetical protein
MRIVGLGWVMATAGTALMLTACPQRDATIDDPMTVDTAVVDTSVVNGRAADAAMEERVDLRPVNESGVEGQAVMHAMGGGTHVVLTVRGARPNSEMSAHLHAGRCDTLGPVVESLESIRTDQSGAGRSETMLDLNPGTVLSGQHFIAIHQEDGGDAAPPVVCGDLPQRDVGTAR